MYGYKDEIKRLVYLIAGVALMAAATDMFFDPFSLVTGGVTGVAVILRSLWGVPLWLTNTVLNVPLFIWAYFVFDRHFVVRSASAALLLSVFLYLMEFMPDIENDAVTVVVFGGLIYGVGIGLVLRSGATTGGTDLAAGIVNRLRPDIGIAPAMLCMDVAVIVSGFAVFGEVRAMYGIMAVAVTTRAMDFVMEGLNFAKAAFIICDNAPALGKAVMEGIDRGATVIPAGGMYSGRDKKMLVVAASRKEIPALKRITAEVEPGAFMFVTDIREILGNF